MKIISQVIILFLICFSLMEIKTTIQQRDQIESLTLRLNNTRTDLTVCHNAFVDEWLRNQPRSK